jgi:hypothetical protein
MELRDVWFQIGVATERLPSLFLKLGNHAEFRRDDVVEGQIHRRVLEPDNVVRPT